MKTFIRDIRVIFQVGFLGCFHHNGDFVAVRICYIGALFHTFYCSFDRGEEFRSSKQGLPYEGVR